MNIPKGWPTEEMIRVGLIAFWKTYGSNLSQIAAPLDDAFKAMLAVAPQPPAEEIGPVADALYEVIKHGDDQHKQWLRDTINTFYASRQY